MDYVTAVPLEGGKWAPVAGRDARVGMVSAGDEARFPSELAALVWLKKTYSWVSPEGRAYRLPARPWEAR